MNNEQNKPTELTEKELEGISGGAIVPVTVTMKDVEVVKKVAVETGAVETGVVVKADGAVSLSKHSRGPLMECR